MCKSIKILVVVIISGMIFGALLALTASRVNAYEKRQIVTATYEKVIGQITKSEVKNDICYITLDNNYLYAIDNGYEIFSTAVNFVEGDIVEITYCEGGTFGKILNIKHR